MPKPPSPELSPPSAGLLTRAVLVLLALSVAGPAVALDGSAAGLTLHDRLFTGNPRDVVVEGSLAFVGLDTGLAVLDLTDPSRPTVVGHAYLTSAALDVCLEGDHAFIASDESGLRIVDVSDPTAPVVVGGLPTSGTCGVDVIGPLAYLAEGTPTSPGVHALRTVDVSDPTAPVALGLAVLPNGGIDVHVVGDHAYVGVGRDMANPARGLAIIDVSDPWSPALVGFRDVGRPVNEVKVSGNVAHLAAGFPLAGAFVTVDVSDPRSPTVLASMPLGDAATGVALDGTSAHVATRSIGLVSFDVSTPSAPAWLDALPTGRESWGVAMSSGAAVVVERSSAGSAAVTVIDVPAPPAPLQELGMHAHAETTDVAAAAGYSYVLRRDALHVFDAVDPDALDFMGEWAPEGADLSGLAVDGTLVAVADGCFVHVLDVAGGGTPQEHGTACVDEGVAVDLLLEGDTLYVVTGRGLEIFDVGTGGEAVPLGAYSGTGWSSALALDGNVAYLAGGDTLEVLDVSSESAPTGIGTLVVADQLFGVASDGGTVALTGLSFGLHVVDASVPSDPRLLASLPGAVGFDVVLEGDRAYVAAGEGGVLGVDVSDPAQPIIDSFYDTSGSAIAVAAEGPTIHVAGLDSQYWVLGCEICGKSCFATSRVTPARSEICAGLTVELAGDTSSASGCDGELLYEWSVDGVLIPGATEATYVVPDDLDPGTATYRLDVRCSTTPDCLSSASADVVIVDEVWPGLESGSLRLTRAETHDEMTWVTAGGGDVNVHVSLNPVDLDVDGVDSSSLIAVSGDEWYANTFTAPLGQVAFFRVFGRGSCSGDSHLAQ